MPYHSSRAADVEAHLLAKQADLDDIKARIAQLDQTKTVATKEALAPVAGAFSSLKRSPHSSL
jgi:hypothetical protein